MTLFGVLLLGQANLLWYSFPLVVVVSLVYAASRHESMEEILRHAGRMGSWIVGLMAIILAILYFLSARL